MADWLSNPGSDAGEDDDALFGGGRGGSPYGKPGGGQSAVNTYKQLAGWALGKGIERSLPACVLRDDWELTS
eukprot:2559331-Rhodomonas_salina.2